MRKLLVKPIFWQGGKIRIIDQTKLPGVLEYKDCCSVHDVWWAIKELKVRGAPLIGITGAMGFLLGMRRLKAKDAPGITEAARGIRDYLASSRPTAVNLFWALDLCFKIVEANSGAPKDKVILLLKKEVERIIRQDLDMCFQMSGYGAGLIKSGDNLLTVCNAGGLATSGYGTALGVFYRARGQKKKIKVYACETRPLLQGARLTAWELARAGIAVTLICDNMAASLMRRVKISAVFAGADRIAANGDFANKIGTYSLAVLARHHHVPFYCVAPFSTLDLSVETGDGIPIEERDAREVTSLYFKKPVAPPGIDVFNPAFDVTPASLVTAIITEKGILRQPLGKNIRAAYK